MAEIIVIKLGGSILSPGADTLFDFGYAYKLQELLAKSSFQKMIVGVGGGYLARSYQELLRSHGEQEVDDIHRVGVAASNLNAEVLRGVWSSITNPEVIRYEQYDRLVAIGGKIDWQAKIQVVGASKPGKSNDWNTLQIALRSNADTVVSLKNVDGVYSADPRKVAEAKHLSQLSWVEYLNVIGNPVDHQPGASYPVDPLTARECQVQGVKFVIMDGRDLDNLRHYLAGEEFRGSVIMD